jgi:methionyl-tRNA synthetase
LRVKGAPKGTTWVCLRCERPVQYREPSARAPDRQRVRADKCDDCERELENRLNLAGDLAVVVAQMIQRGKVRRVPPYQPFPGDRA